MPKMLRCWNVNGNNITYDNDITTLIYWFFNQWIISWFQVSAGSVGVWSGILYATRTNWEIVAVAIENTTSLTLDTSGTKKVYLTINQAKLDDGSENNVDGTGIVSVATWASYPVSNCIKLASISGGTITDEREYVTLKANKVTWDLNFVNSWVPKLNGVGLNVANWLLKLNAGWKIDSSLFDVSLNIWDLSETTTPQSAWYTIVYNWTMNLKTSLSNFTKSLAYATKALQWVLRFATDSEATTWTIDTVAITPKQAKDNYYSEIWFSDQVIWNSTSTPAATWPLTKKWEFTITRSGGYRIKATLICNTSSSSSYTNTVKIYKNWVEVATNSANLNTNWQTVATQIDLNLVAWDVIAGYIANSDSRTIQLSLDMCASAFPTIAKPTKNL